MLLLIVLSTLTLGSAALKGACRFGFTPNQDQTLCLKANNQQVTFGQARSLCQDLAGRDNNGDLVTFNSQENEDEVRRVFNKISTGGFWIGLSFNENSGEFQWASSTTVPPFFYLNWGSNEPRNPKSSRCVISLESGWSTINCNTAQPFVCSYSIQDDQDMASNWFDSKRSKPATDDAGGVLIEDRTRPNESALDGDSGDVLIEDRTRPDESSLDEVTGDSAVDDGDDNIDDGSNNATILTAGSEIDENSTADPIAENATVLTASTESDENSTTDSITENGGDDCEQGKEWTKFGVLDGRSYCVLVKQDNPLSWFAARTECQKSDADLLVVPNTDVHKSVRNLISSKDSKYKRFRFWSGLNVRPDDGSLAWNDYPFEWTDQGPDSQFGSRWCKQLFDNVEEPHCGVVIGWKNGRWNNVTCSEEHYFICMPNDVIHKLLDIKATERSFFTTPGVTNQSSTLGPQTTQQQVNDTDTTAEQTEEGVIISQSGGREK